MKNLNFFEKLWEHSRTLRRVGLVLVMCLIAIPQAWALNSTFTKGETIFIIGDSKANSAWNSNACVKAWFNTSGSGGSAEATTWLAGGDSENKVFWTIVPSTGLNQVQLQRFASNCSTWWNSNGDVLQSNRSKDSYNTLYSNGSGTANCGWKDMTYEFYLRGNIGGDFASDLATFEDKGDGLFQCTYTFTASNTSHSFKVRDCKNHWFGRQSDGNNYVLNGLTNGTSYTVVASFNIQDCAGGNKTSLSVVTIHKPGVYTSASGYNKSLTSWANGLYERYGFYNGGDADMRILPDASSSSSASSIATFTKNTSSATGWLSAYFSGRTNGNGLSTCEFTSFGNNGFQVHTSSNMFVMCVQGYDSLRIIGNDASNNKGNNQYIQVKVNGVDLTDRDHLSNSSSIRKYKLDASTLQYIQISGASVSGSNTLHGFSLRPAAPSITASSLSGASYTQGDAATNLSVTASPVVAGATLTYQWYSNTTASNSGGTIVDGATNATFAPPTTSVGTTYYYCIVSEAGCNSTTSSVSGAIVVAAGGCTSVSAPTGLSCSAQTKNTLTFTWTEAPNASGYEAKLWSNSECSGAALKTQSLGDANSVTFTSLSAGTNYWCKVQSKGDGSTYCESGGTTSAQSGTTKTVHTISFDINGGTSGTMTDITGIEYGSSQTLTANTYSRTGWEFDGWNTTQYGDGTSYAAGASMTVTGNVTLYAKWKKVVYMVSSLSWWYNADAWFAVYCANDAEDKTAWVKMEVADNCSSPVVYKATIPGNSYTKMAFVRKNPASETLATWDNKWNRTTYLSLPTSNNKFTISTGTSDDCNGSWGTYSAPTFTISYAKGSPSASISGEKSNETKNCGVAFTLPSSAVFTRPGYTQTGWATSDGGPKAYNLGGSYTIESSQTFYPFWTPNQYSVGHTLSNVTATSGATGTNAATCGTNYTAVFSASSGYTLPDAVTVTIGGAAAPSGSYTWTKGSGTVLITGSYIIGDVVISVSGVSKKTVTYKKNGGASGADGSVTGSTTDASSPYAHGSTVTTIASGFTNAGYKFKWWNTAYDGSGEDFYVGEKFNITANTNLFAQWEEVASGQAFWVGDVAISDANTAYDVAGNSATMQIKRETNADWNSDISKDWNQVSKYSGTAKKAKVLAVDNNDSYIEVNFKDGSAINALELGVCNKDGNDNEMVVIYSTTADFSSGVGEKVAKNTKKFDQSTKAVYDVSPSTPDLYKYARIYRRVTTAVYGLTGGSDHIIRIYSIKAEKGAACESLDAPEGLSCTTQTKNSLTFGWSAVTYASSYDVYLYSDADCTAEVTPTEGKPYNVTGTSATLTGLDAGTTYYCKVRTKGNGTTYCTNGGITTTAASGKTKYGVTYSKGGATSGTAPTDDNSYAYNAEVTVKDTTGCKFVYASHTFRGWTDGTTFYKVGQTFRMPNENVTLTAVWDSEASGESCTTFTGSSGAYTYSTTHWTMYAADSNGRYSTTNRWAANTTGCNGSAYSFQGDKRFLLKFDEDVVGIHFHAYNGSARTVDGISITTTEPVSGKTASYTALSSSTDYSCTKTGTTGCQEFEVEFSSAITAGTWIWVKMSDAVVIQEMCYSTSGSGEGWTNKYVAFDNNAGVVGTPSLPDTIWGVPSGKKIVQPADPTATGYIFDNWYPTQACNTSAFDWSGTITKDTTLYAKFNAPTTLIEQPAKVAGKRVPIDTLDAKNHPEIDSVIVHQLIDPAPYGTCNITYQLNYSATHTPLDEQPKIRMGKGAGVGYDTIWMPMNETMVYEIVAYLRNSADSAAGDLVTTDTALVSVEKTWPIKVRYVMDGVELRDPTEWPVYPSYRTTEIRVMKEQQGYVFDSLEYGVGITVDSVKANWSSMAYATYVKAANASTITAHYKVPDTTVYFFNTFDKYWYSTRVWKYEYGADGNWDGSTGSGAYGLTGDSMKISSYDDENRDKLKVHLTSGKTKMSFTSRKMNGSVHFWGTKSPNEIPHVIYRDDYNDALKMFVPVSTNEDVDYITMNKTATGEAHYYRGFWVRRSPDRDSTGYFLHVFDKVDQATASHIQSLPLRLTQSGANDTWELTATMDLEAGKTYGFKITKANTGGTIWLSNSGTMTSANHTGWVLDGTSNNIGLTTTGAGNYTFHVFCKAVEPANPSAVTAAEIQGKLAVTVDYATLDGDFRVVYQDDSQIDLTDNSGVEPIASQSIRARANGQDTVTFFIRKDAANRSMKFQKFNAGAWSDVTGGTIALTNTTGQTFTVSTDTTYQIYIQQNADGTSVEATGMDYYSGLYYIRTDCVDEHKWDYMQSPEAHRLVESDYASHLATDPFTHYYVHWVDKNKNVKFVVATQYSPTLTDTLITDTYANVAGGNLPAAGASVRFMYHKKTNWIKRAYLAGAQGGSLDPDFLKLAETSSGKMKNTSGSAISSITFSDLGNFTYQAEIKAQPGLAGKLTAEYNSNTQYFRGTALAGETILGGSGSGWQNIVMTYDFKTNRLICAWTPSGDSINGDMAINADIMIIRKGQDDAQQIVFKTNESKLTDVKYIYGVIQLDYNDLVGMMPTWDWWSYGHCMYYISFPFDVLVSDITGVGTIGQEWRLQRYNGAKRAEKGWFIDGEKTFWEDLHAGDTLKAYEGYSLLLNRTRFNSSSSSIWENKSRGSSVYLFFPSMNASTGIVSDGSVTVHVPAHECTKDQTFINSHGMLVNHKVTDSHWNMLGTPIFADTTAFSMDEGPRIDGEYSPLQYVYAWNHYGNTLGIQLTLTTKWKFKAMYSYMVQYAGNVVFKGSTVSKIVAAHRNSEKKNYHVNLELTKDEQFIGRTYVQLRENAVDSFLLNEDIYMVRNGVNADLFTYAGGYEAGANVLPIADQTVQVGIAVKKAGTYVFSMPDNFDGEVTLVDTYAQTRTNLSIEDYEIALPTGEITDRFYLEININKMPTAIDGVDANQGALKDGKAHKFIENDMMYILKDGVLYDARGNRVK